MRNNQTKKKETKKKPLHEMTLLDNFLFREAMNVPEMFGILVNICMEKHVVFNGKPHVEKVFSAQPDLREIRVDVYSESVHEAVYSIEMHKDNTKNLQKRSREVNDKYMFWWEEVEQYKDEARAEGLEEGRREGRREGKREGGKASGKSGVKPCR